MCSLPVLLRASSNPQLPVRVLVNKEKRLRTTLPCVLQLLDSLSLIADLLPLLTQPPGPPPAAHTADNGKNEGSFVGGFR
jgi:hypothetical protein